MGSGPLRLWALGPLGFGPLGLLGRAPWASGPLGFGPLGLRAPWASGPLGFGPLGLRVPWTNLELKLVSLILSEETYLLKSFEFFLNISVRPKPDSFFSRLTFSIPQQGTETQTKHWKLLGAVE